MNQISTWLLNLRMWWLEQRIAATYRRMTPQDRDKLKQMLLGQ